MDWGESGKKSLEKRGFAIKRFLGQGAFSRVYCVEERRTGRRAACKISSHTKLLQKEEEILKKLKHPLFPEYYENWQEENTGFLLMEEIAGENLAELIRRGGNLSVYRIAEVGMELAEGLLYLHECRPAVIFRDVKPENIILKEDGRVKLLDFGCACMPDTDSGTRAGTPGYSAPEQLAESGRQTHLCDVYGLGRTLQDLLWAGTRQVRQAGLFQRQETGCRLWAGRNGERSFREDLRERRDRKRLEKLLAACVEEEPSARPADMRVVMAALCHICTPAVRGGKQGGQSSDFWQKGVLCEKNIRKSSPKTS